MIAVVQVPLAFADFALACGLVVDFCVSEDADAAVSSVVDHFLAAQTHLAGASLDVEDLVELANRASLGTQVVETALGTAEANLLVVSHKRLFGGAAGEVIGSRSFEELDLVVALGSRAVVPVASYQVILEETSAQIYEPSGFFVHVVRAVITIKRFVNEFEVGVGHV